MVLRWPKKREELDAVEAAAAAASAAAPQVSSSELDDVGSKVEPVTPDNGDDKTRLSLESLNIEQAWLMRLKTLQKVFDDRLWLASALGGDPAIEDDLGWIELTHKAECMFIELRCSLATTSDAPQVIVNARSRLSSLKTLVGARDYPRAVMGIIQSVLHEQQMGFHTTPGSIWDFDEAVVDSKYAHALKKFDEMWFAGKGEGDDG